MINIKTKIITVKKWTIVIEDINGFKQGIVTNGFIVDYPVFYDNGTVGYEFPERLPEFVKAAVSKFAVKGANINVAGTPDAFEKLFNSLSEHDRQRR